MRQTTWLGHQRNLKPEVSLKEPLGNPTHPFSLFLRTTSVECSGVSTRAQQDRALRMLGVLCEGAQPHSPRLHGCPGEHSK